MIPIDHLDHLVLTVADPDATCAFYERVLGMRRVVFGGGRLALAFGQQKINLHQAGREIAPSARRPTPGSADLCFVATCAIGDILSHLTAVAAPVELGPVVRTGALGPITSVYLRDPDQNLVEIAVYAAVA